MKIGSKKKCPNNCLVAFVKDVTQRTWHIVPKVSRKKTKTLRLFRHKRKNNNFMLSYVNVDQNTVKARSYEIGQQEIEGRSSTKNKEFGVRNAAGTNWPTRKEGAKKETAAINSLIYTYSGQISPPDVSATCPSRPVVSSVWSVGETWAKLVREDHHAESATMTSALYYKPTETEARAAWSCRWSRTVRMRAPALGRGCCYR